MIVNLPDAAATEGLGQTLARALAASAGGWVIFLSGDLGAGKTTLARQLLRSAGVDSTIRSPTYTLMEPYRAHGREFLHMDLYRLNHPAELYHLGLADYSPERTVWLVEWPEKGGNLLPQADLSINLDVVGETRRAEVRGLTEAGRTLLSTLS